MMKTSLFRFSFLFSFAVALLTACSGGSESDPDTDAGSSTPSGQNANKNLTAVHPEYGRLEVPRLASGNYYVLIHRSPELGVNYMTEWDATKKAQRWSAYIMTAATMEKNVSRYEPSGGELQYPFDDQLPQDAYFSKDPFSGSGYQHGHVCPSADRLSSRTANKQTFYLTNMQPQVGDFNEQGGTWYNMENKVRSIAGRSAWVDTLFVVKGGTIGDGKYVNAATGKSYNLIYRTLDNGLVVPRYFFVALLRKKGNLYDGVALWFSQIALENDIQDARLAKYAISIDELEARTGIDFFCNLPDDVEQTVEKECNTSLWGFN